MNIKSGHRKVDISIFSPYFAFWKIGRCNPHINLELKNAKISKVEKTNRFFIFCPSQNFRNLSFDAWKLNMVGETGSSAGEGSR